MNEKLVTLARQMPPAYKSFTTARASRDKSFDPIRQYHKDMAVNFLNGVGVMMSGPNGVGKTGWLAVLFMYAVKLYPQWGVHQRLWLRARDVAQTYGYHLQEQEFDYPVDSLLQEAKILVIDELGRESDIKNFDRRMHNLIQRRVENRRVTLFTTNLSLDADPEKPGTVRTVYGEGFWSLLHQSCLAVTVSGPDRRMGE
jgi:DNA replication protein DnaC